MCNRTLTHTHTHTVREFITVYNLLTKTVCKRERETVVRKRERERLWREKERKRGDRKKERVKSLFKSFYQIFY